MDLDIIIERLNQLTAYWNTLVSNSKKIIELPTETTGDKLIATYNTTNNETEQYNLTNLISRLNEISNRILIYGEYTEDGNDYTFEIGYVWFYDGITYANSSDIEITIDDAADGFYRDDIIVVDTNNNILKVVGVESETVAVAPEVPEGMLLLYTISIFGNDIDPPVVGPVGFIEKETHLSQTYNGTGVLNTLAVNTKQSVIAFVGTTTEFQSVQKNFDNWFDGQIAIFDNRQIAIDILLTHLDGTGNVLFWFPSLVDFILRKGFKAMFRFNKPLMRLEYIGEILSGTTNEITISNGLIGIDPAYTTARNTYADSRVQDSISDGTIDKAPSQNAVFDALALKANSASPTFTGSVVIPDATANNQPVSLGQILNPQIEVSGNQTADVLWNGKEITFMTSGLLTIPSTLPSEYSFALAADSGVTITWAITAPHTWRVAGLTVGTPPPTMTAGQFCQVSKRIGTNEIRVRGL